MTDQDTGETAPSDCLASAAPDAEADHLSYRIGRHTVGENLERAVSTGKLDRAADGTYVLPADERPNDRTVYNKVTWPYPCRKLLFLFDHVYERAQVPWTCRNCYKVKVSPRKVTDLVAVHDATVAEPYPSKFQPDMDAPYSTDIYGAYFYAEGLEQARKIYWKVREALAAKGCLDRTPISIKRGCTEYEMHCGPSDQYVFPEALAEVERDLLSRISVAPYAKPPVSRGQALLMWIRQAYRIGDDSYLELTGGRRLFPETLKYDP
ncbi:hypothetical protein [Ferrovibrio sp.]|uniref:hypothetical protein n=1 Tax=Ferrovibrio sp. TaxID=1917215 RepID=UPI003D0C13D5